MNSIADVTIIGGDSFIGRNLYNYLENLGLEVCCTSHKNKTDFLNLNLLDNSSKWPRIKSKVAIICAGVTSIKKCNLNKESYAINVNSTIKLIDRLTSEGIFTIFLSSSQVFNGMMPNSSRENSCNPLSVYGEHKYLVEKKIKEDISNKCILRITKIINKSLPLFHNIYSKLNDGKKIKVFKNYFISPVTIDLTCEIILKIIKLKKEGIYQLSSSDQISYYDMANLYVKNLGLDYNLIEGTNAKAFEIGLNYIPKYSYLEMDKEKLFFNFDQPTSKFSINSILN
ncbi:MAG: hypothetical protein CFH01_00657 [Alphaproteobacteria bacterium MarineAlpha2_Bin1]|nr:MAG: hypothetical protein CFH01_00657 [Alphaproteobacteria bacterium MarineAlpha2_Bin1]